MFLNIETIHFNHETCQQMIDDELNKDSKREFIQALYTYELYNMNIFHLQREHSNCTITFSSEISEIQQYQSAIFSKIKGHITNEEFEKSTHMIEKSIKLFDEEIQSEKFSSIRQHLKKQIQTSNNIKKYKC